MLKPRVPLLLSLLLALLTAIPVSQAVAAAPAGAAVASADEEPGDEWGDEWGADEDPGDWDDEESDEWGADEICLSDEEWEEWSEEELAAAAESDDDAWEDEDACEEEAWDEAGEDEGEGASAPAPVRLSKLHATPARRGAVRVSFRLDRGSRVTLTLQRLGGARPSGKPRALKGSVRLAGRKGANATTLRRWKGRALKPGSYRLTTSPDGSGARPASTVFTLRAAAAARR